MIDRRDDKKLSEIWMLESKNQRYFGQEHFTRWTTLCSTRIRQTKKKIGSATTGSTSHDKKQKRSMTIHETNLHQNVTSEDLDLLLASSINLSHEVGIHLIGARLDKILNWKEAYWLKTHTKHKDFGNIESLRWT